MHVQQNRVRVTDDESLRVIRKIVRLRIPETTMLAALIFILVTRSKKKQ